MATRDRNEEEASLSHAIAERLVAMLPTPRQKRLNLVLSESHIKRLERLQILTDASSVAEVIRAAVFAYETLVEKVMNGSRLKELTSKSELHPLELGIDAQRPILRTIVNGEGTPIGNGVDCPESSRTKSGS
jgi:uncharacterized linocin/CFP29 family protein